MKDLHSKTKLVYYNSAIRPNLFAWQRPDLHPDWIIPHLNVERALKKWEEYNAILVKCGKIGVAVGDRWNKHQLFYNMDCSWLPAVEYKYYDEITDFYDVMMKSAEWVASNGNQIDFMWSGGLDSTCALLALNETCPKQLRIIMNENSKLEHPKLWKDLVQHLDHVIDTDDDVLGIGRPDINTWVNCSEADAIFGQNGARWQRDPVRGPADLIDDPWERWKDKYRYGLPVRTWRMLHTFKKDWLDINNVKPFFVSEFMQKWVCNMHHKDEIVWYTNTPEDPCGEHYLKCKMDLRDFIVRMSGDDAYGYGKLKMNSLSGTEQTATFGSPLSGQWQLRIFEQARLNVTSGKHKYLPEAIAEISGIGVESLWPVYAIGADGTVYSERNMPRVDWQAGDFERRFIDQDYMTFLNPEMFDD